MTYEEFKALVHQLAESRPRQGGLVSIPELWTRCRADLPRPAFEQYVVSLGADGLAHLLSHVDTASLSDEVRADCLPHASGPLLYWIRWL